MSSRGGQEGLCWLMARLRCKDGRHVRYWGRVLAVTVGTLLLMGYLFHVPTLLSQIHAVDFLAGCVCVVCLAGGIGWRWWWVQQRQTPALESLIQIISRQTSQLDKTLRRDKSWQRFSAGMLIPLQLEPAAAHRGPWVNLNACACIERLAQLAEGWERERQRQRQREQRRQRLDMTVALLDFNLALPELHHGLLDEPALHTEHLLLHVDPGAGVLHEVPALFARRVWLAIQALSDKQKTDAQHQWQCLQMVWELSADITALSERSLLICVLAQNRDMDLEKIQTAYALAQDYRTQLVEWLARAAQIQLTDMKSLDHELLAHCVSSVSLHSDDVEYVLAMQPLHTAFVKWYTSLVSQLVAIADHVELQQGVRSLATQLRLRQTVV